MHNIFRSGSWIFILLCFYSGLSLAQKPYQKEIELLRAQNKQLQQVRQISTQLQVQLNDMGKEIRTLKEKQQSDFFQNAQLQKKMQSAQNLSLELKKLYKHQANLQETLTLQINALLKKIEKNLAESHLRKEEDNKMLMKTYVDLQELSPLPQSVIPSSSLFAFSLSNDAPLDRAEIKDQIIVLQDLQIHLRGLITAIQKKASIEQQKIALNKELAFLINEEQFFGEQGFIQGRARKRELEASTETPDPDASPTDPTDPTDPIDPDPIDPDPIDPDPIDPIDPDPTDPIDPDLNMDPFPEVMSIDQNFDTIDPKFQTQMVEDMFIFSPTNEHHDSNQEIQLGTSDDLLITNPQLISKNIEQMQRRPNEAQDDFVNRKIAYLEKMLHTLQDQTSFLQKKLEAK